MSKTIIELQLFIDSKPETREIVNEVVDYLQANPTPNIIDYSINAFSLLGSQAKAFPIGYTLANLSSSQPLTDNRLYLIAVELRAGATITGVKFFQSATANFTSDQYNGVGIYTISAGVLTLAGSSINDGNIWKGTINTIQSKAFSSQYIATAGVYYIALLYNSSAQVVAPAIVSAGTISLGIYMTGDFTNSCSLWGTLDGQNSLPNSINMSSVTPSSLKIFPFLY